MRVLLAGVIYPSAMKYYDEMLGSIMGQTDCQFDVLIVNDGVGQFVEIPDRMNTVCASGDVFDNRMQTIDYAIDNSYDYICWIDADDLLTENRIERIKEIVSREKTDIVIHDLYTMNEAGKLSGQLFVGRKKQAIFLEDVLYYNLAGFGNTVIAVSCLKKYRSFLQKPATSIAAVDWWLIVNLLAAGATAMYVPEGLYLYRIFDGNISIGNEEDKIRNRINVIRNHYKAVYKQLLLALNQELIKDLNAYTEQLDTINELDYQGFKDLKEKTPTGIHQVWWEDIYRQLMR